MKYYSENPEIDALRWETEKELQDDLFQYLYDQKQAKPEFDPCRVDNIVGALSSITKEQENMVESVLKKFTETNDPLDAYTFASMVYLFSESFQHSVIEDEVNKEIEGVKYYG